MCPVRNHVTWGAFKKYGCPDTTQRAVTSELLGDFPVQPGPRARRDPPPISTPCTARPKPHKHFGPLWAEKEPEATSRLRLSRVLSWVGPRCSVGCTVYLPLFWMVACPRPDLLDFCLSPKTQSVQFFRSHGMASDNEPHALYTSSNSDFTAPV